MMDDSDIEAVIAEFVEVKNCGHYENRTQMSRNILSPTSLTPTQVPKKYYLKYIRPKERPSIHSSEEKPS